MSRGAVLWLSPILIAVAVSFSAFAEDSPQSYIDELKNEMESVEQSNESYTQSLKNELESASSEEGAIPEKGYTEALKASDPSLNQAPQTSYTQEEKAKIPPKKGGGAIQAFNEGKSDLHANKGGTIHNAYGVKYGVSLSRQISSSAQLRNFDTVYGGYYAPDIAFFYEYQPFHSEWFGNIGIVGMVELSYFHGPGVFGVSLSRPSGGAFPSNALTQFQFYSIPVMVGLDYRFNLFRFLRPYIMLGGTAVGYIESRNDGVSGSHGHTEGYIFSVGTSLLLDWFSEASAWDLYATFGVKHYYLSVDYTRTATFTNEVRYNVSGFMVGLTFEF